MRGGRAARELLSPIDYFGSCYLIKLRVWEVELGLWEIMVGGRTGEAVGIRNDARFLLFRVPVETETTENFLGLNAGASAHFY